MNECEFLSKVRLHLPPSLQTEGFYQTSYIKPGEAFLDVIFILLKILSPLKHTSWSNKLQTRQESVYGYQQSTSISWDICVICRFYIYLRSSFDFYRWRNSAHLVKIQLPTTVADVLRRQSDTIIQSYGEMFILRSSAVMLSRPVTSFFSNHTIELGFLEIWLRENLNNLSFASIAASK